MTSTKTVTDLLAELAAERNQPVALTLLEALTTLGIAPHRWTGTWLKYLPDETVIEALELLRIPRGT